jgi:hypothetical protein
MLIMSSKFTANGITKILGRKFQTGFFFDFFPFLRRRRRAAIKLREQPAYEFLLQSKSFNGFLTEGHFVVIYYAIFWLPAAVTAIGAGTALARPVWRLLTQRA